MTKKFSFHILLPHNYKLKKSMHVKDILFNTNILHIVDTHSAFQIGYFITEYLINKHNA